MTQTQVESGTGPKGRHILIFDMMRHRSHLFFRYLSTHEDIRSQWHPYLEASIFGPERITRFSEPSPLPDGTMGEFRVGVSDGTYEDARKDVIAARDKAAKEGKILVTNEHIQFVSKHEILKPYLFGGDYIGTMNSLENPTELPDEIFGAIEPIFVIRNPVFTVRSNYTALRATAPTQPDHSDWRVMLAMPLQRAFFDFLTKKNGKRPLVVDGDDVLWRPDELADGLCKELGIEHKLFKAWGVWPHEDRTTNFLVKHFLAEIYESIGIITPEEGRADESVEANHKLWVDMFGQERADQLKDTAVQNMPHYEYMKQFKI